MFAATAAKTRLSLEGAAKNITRSIRPFEAGVAAETIARERPHIVDGPAKRSNASLACAATETGWLENPPRSAVREVPEEDAIVEWHPAR